MTKPIHQVRHAPPARRDRKPAVQVAEYPPGHFTELIRAHNWPPQFEPTMQRARNPDASAIASAARDGMVARGITGTIVGLSPKSDAEQLMRRLAL